MWAKEQNRTHCSVKCPKIGGQVEVPETPHLAIPMVFLDPHSWKDQGNARSAPPSLAFTHGSGSTGIDLEECLHRLVRLAPDHIKRLQAILGGITVPAFRIDRHDLERVVEEHPVAG